MTDIAVADKYGKVVSSYSGASKTIPDMAYWPALRGSADAHLLPELQDITDRGRDLERNNGVAAGWSQTYVDNVIGPRLKLTATPNWQALGQSQEWADEWSREVEARWKVFANSSGFDLERQLDFHDMAKLTLREKLGGGGSLLVPRWKPGRPGVNYSTCLQMVDIDRLCNPDGEPETDKFRGGRKFNSDGAPIAYYVRNKHPNDYSGIYDGEYSWERIPAFTPFGRPMVLHCYDKLRAGQTRGTPKLAAVLREFKSLSRYTDAELSTAVAQARNAYFVESHLPAEMIGQMFGDDIHKYLEDRTKIGSTAQSRLANVAMDDASQVIPIMPGDKIIDPQPSRPNEQFHPFVMANMRRIAAGLNISYEMLMRDFSQTNYSSARAAMLLDWKTFAGELKWVQTSYAQQVYGLFLEEDINRGDIEAPGFLKNREAYCACKITGSGRGYIDPQKESKASTERLHNGVGTLDGENSEQSQDWQDTQDQRAREIKRAFEKTETMELPEVAAYVLAGLPIPGQFQLQSPIDPENGPGAVTETQEEKAENAGVAQGA